MLKLILLVLAASALCAQVSMPVSPVLGSPANLTINWNSTQTDGPIVLIMHANPGQVQGSCYVSLNRDSSGVWASVYQTTTSTADQPYTGLLGPGGPFWATTIYSNACEINLPSSGVTATSVTLRISNGVTPYNKQVVANYSVPCTGWQCGWGANFVSTTIGWWDATPSGGGGGSDTTPPAISQVGHSSTSTGAVISWLTTNEISDSQVDFGLSSAYGSSSILNSTLLNSHTVVLTNLAPSTSYYYRVRSRDAAGNLATAPGGPFTTGAGSSFTMSVAPASQLTVQGKGTSHTISITGITAAVSLSAPVLPPGAVASFSNNNLLSGESATLAMTVPVGTPAGQYPYSVSAQAGSGPVVSVSGMITVTAKTSPLVLNLESQVFAPSSGNNIWEPTTAGGNAWVTAWNTLTDGASNIVDARIRSWDGTWIKEKILTAPGNGRVLGDLYLSWDPTRRRYLICAIDIPQEPGGITQPPRNVWYGFSSHDLSSWTIEPTAALSAAQADWDYPSCAVDNTGRIGIGAVSVSSGTSDQFRFYARISNTSGVFSTPAAPISVTINAGQSSKAPFTRLVAAGAEFHAFVPTLNASYLPTEVNRYSAIVDGIGQLSWSAPQQLYQFDAPRNTSQDNYCKTPSECRQIFYASAHLDARGSASGHWAVVFPVRQGGSPGRNNLYMCTSFRGCSFINQVVNDQFLASVALSDQPGSSQPTIWVSYLTYPSFSSSSSIGDLPLESRSIYYLPGQPGVGAVTNSSILPTYWLVHNNRCSPFPCFASGDYAGMAANPFAAAAAPVVVKYLLGNALNQLFVQDPESDTKGQTFSLPWSSVSIGIDGRSASPFVDSSPAIDPATRRGPLGGRLSGRTNEDRSK